MPSIVIAKNITNEDIFISDLGFTISANSERNLSDNFPMEQIASSEELRNFISSNDIIINDGYRNLSKIDGLRHVRFETEHEDEDFVDKHKLTDHIDVPEPTGIKEEVLSSFDATNYNWVNIPKGINFLSEVPDSTSVIWYNINDNITYVFNTVLNEWLSISRLNFIFSYNGASVANVFLKCGDINHSDSGILIPRPMTILCICGRNIKQKEERTCRLFDHNQEIYTFSWPNKNVIVDLNLNVNPGTILKVKSDSNPTHSLSFPTVDIMTAFRYDPTWDGSIPEE